MEAKLDAIVIGAGFGGLYMLHRLRRLGLRAKVLEAAPGIGGTWYWNRYPGARCDVESVDYSYSFDDDLQQEWEWSERYAAQPEILRYIEHVADRFDLRRDILLETEVASARFDSGSSSWHLTSSAGESFEATFCIAAVGCLSAVNPPHFPGQERFRGRTFLTARWPHEGVDLSGESVAVIGTGSTGVQAIPVIAAEADRVVVFQRSPNYSFPAGNQPLDPAVQAEVKADYQRRREAAREAAWGVPVLDKVLRPYDDLTPEQRREICEAGWRRGGPSGALRAFSDTMTNPEANREVADFVREKIAAIVADPQTARALTPTDHPLGAKRLCLDSGYYETYNRENVELVDLRETPIEELTERGIRTSAAEYEVDTIVFALGFDAITGALLAIDFRGEDGVSLRERWADGPRAYLGLAIAGFPNLLTITGPGSPSVLGNVIVSIEQHVDWIAECLATMTERGLDRIEVVPEAEAAWVDHVGEVAEGTLFLQAKSWFLGANIEGKPRTFMPYAGGVPEFRRRCEEVVANGYEGFLLSSAAGR